MRFECINVNALVSVQQSGAFGDWDGQADPLPSRLRGRGGQNGERNDGCREGEAHSRKMAVTKGGWE